MRKHAAPHHIRAACRARHSRRRGTPREQHRSARPSGVSSGLAAATAFRAHLAQHSARASSAGSSTASRGVAMLAGWTGTWAERGPPLGVATSAGLGRLLLSIWTADASL
eukprot:356968-Chlamydomonas_euryale.AAC.8